MCKKHFQKGAVSDRLKTMETFSGEFTFTNKENVSLPQKPLVASNKGKDSIQETPNKLNKPIVFHNNKNNSTANNKGSGNVLRSRKISVLSDVKTPISSKHQNLSHGQNAPAQGGKRIPLGGKDKNAILNHNLHMQKPGVSSLGSLNSLGSNMLKRPSRLRTPKKKLNILKEMGDDSVERIVNDKVNVFKDDNVKFELDGDDEIEYVPRVLSEMPDKPLNYEPFTEEELYHIAHLEPNPRLEDLSEQNNKDEVDIYEEYPLNFSEDDQDIADIDDVEVKENQFHFMEPTFAANARRRNKSDSISEGVTSAELLQLINEQ